MASTALYDHYHSVARVLSGEDSSLSHAPLATIIGTGILLGIVHVLTGPDHLSALAAMTTNSSWKAFSLGIRWGCGHSIGLLIMALIFFAAGRSFDLNKVGVYCNYIVGVFMIALGFWTLVHVKKKYKSQVKDAQLLRAESNSGRCNHLHNHHQHHSHPTLAHVERVPSSGDHHHCHHQQQSPMQQLRDSAERTPQHRVDVVVHSTPSPTTSYHLLALDDCAEEKSQRASEVQANLEQQQQKKKRCCTNVSFSNPTTQRVRYAFPLWCPQYESLVWTDGSNLVLLSTVIGIRSRHFWWGSSTASLVPVASLACCPRSSWTTG